MFFFLRFKFELSIVHLNEQINANFYFDYAFSYVLFILFTVPFLQLLEISKIVLKLAGTKPSIYTKSNQAIEHEQLKIKLKNYSYLH